MKGTVLLVLVFLSLASYSFAKEYKVNSPDNRISLVVNVGSDIKWSASLDGKEIINSTKVAIKLADGKILGENEKIKRVKISQLNEIIKPVVAHKRSEITDNCNIIVITFNSGFSLQFRAYNDGVAYRFETFLKGDIKVTNEISDFQFPAGTHSWYPLEESFMSHDERIFLYSSLDTIGDKHLASLPTLFQVNGANILITDWTSRDMELNLSFLPEGEYSIDIFQDGMNADRYAGDYKHLKNSVKSSDKMKIHLAPGGGWAARISPK